MEDGVRATPHLRSSNPVLESCRAPSFVALIISPMAPLFPPLLERARVADGPGVLEAPEDEPAELDLPIVAAALKRPAAAMSIKRPAAAQAMTGRRG
eukprot:8874182-Pyramimonas_sp.AAC.1